MKYRKPIREKNYLYISNRNVIVNKYLFQYQIKKNPQKPQESNKVPKDINLNDIFNHMLNKTKEIYRYNNNNSLFIKLSQDLINKRKIIIESIKCFILQNKIRYKLFYNVIFLFDLLYIKNQQHKLLNEIEKIGLGSTILTLKFNYEEIRMITSKKYKNIFKNKYYSSKEIKEIEILCLQLINYNLNLPCPISFMEIMLLNRIISYQDDIKKDSKKRIYNLIMNTMEKILCESNEYIKYNPLNLCCCIIYYTREILGIEKWPRILSNLFNTNFNSFEIIYNEYFKIYKHKDNIRNNNYDSSNNNSTNIDSQVNLSSKRNDKKDDINEKNIKNSLYSKINYFYQNYKCNIEDNKKYLNISQGRLNNNANETEKKKARNRYNKSVGTRDGKIMKEIYTYQKDLQKDKIILYKNKSNLDIIFKVIKDSSSQKNNNNKSLSNKYNDKYYNYKDDKNYNIINTNEYKNYNIQTIDLNNNLDKIESIRNIKVCLKPFLRNQNYKDNNNNNNLDNIMNTESNINHFNNGYIGINENKNNTIYQKETIPYNNNINNIDISYYNRIKRHSSCEIKSEKINKYLNNNYDTSMEKVKRRHFFYSKNVNERFIDKDKENEEDKNKNSFFNTITNHNIKTRNDYNNNYSIMKSIEVLNKNNINNDKNNDNFERNKNEEQKDAYNKILNSNKSLNKENYRFNSLEKNSGYNHNKNSSEKLVHNYEYKITKNNHTRNYYKQKVINMNRLFNKN